MKTASLTRISFVVVIVLGLCGYAYAEQTIYVDGDADGANDGSSWADAFNYLQDALADAGDGDEIRVAQGIYKPDQGVGITPGDRNATFQLINGVTLKGCYAGFGESDPDARNITAYKTILSGDLAGNDVEVGDPCDLLTEPTRSENSEHILRVGQHGDNPPVLDGFTITGGNSDYSGGGLVMGEGDLIVVDCIFMYNSAGYSGGVMTGYNSRVIFERCCFIRNAAAEHGGAIFTDSCTCRQAYVACIDCVFINNSAGGNGGAVHLSSMITMVASCINCLFVGNRAGGYGGALYDYTSDGTISLVNCTLSGNSTGGTEPCGGSGYSSMALTSCILWDNEGQAICSDEVSFKYSNVEDGPTGDGNIDADPCFVGPGYWDADGLWIDGDYRLLPGSPCMDAGDPDFVVGPHGVTIPEGDYYIWEDSTSGYIAVSSETDLDGKPRVVGVRVDMGAYEVSEVPMYELTVTVVNGHGTVEPDSGSYYSGTVVTLTATPEPGYMVRQWTGTDDDTSCALTNTVTMDSDKTVTVEFGQSHVFLVPGGYTTIQGAIDAAGCGDIVVLSAGVYFEDINFHGKNIRVTSPNPDDPMCVASTIIQGTGAGPVVTFSGSESQNCVLDGLTITDGNTTGNGGGICGNGTEATIAKCVITNNHADGYGGGVSDCSGKIERCTITGNTAYRGGGVGNTNCVVAIKYCNFTSNSAAYGGGIYSLLGEMTVINCSFAANTAFRGGGALFNSSTYATFLNCIFSGNSNDEDDIGGGLESNSGIQTFINCTFSGNVGAIEIYDDSVLKMQNCIVAYDKGQLYFESGNVVEADYCCIPDWVIQQYGGKGNFDADPCLVDPDGDDNIFGTEDDNLRLLRDSPCINAGDPDYVPGPGETDLDGNPRLIGGRVDMGAYEFLYAPQIIYVDDDAPNDPGPGDPTVSDPLEDGTQAHPFDAIQEAIDTAWDGDTVIVLEGTYTGTGNRDIDFLGKAITVRSIDPNAPNIVTATIIDCDGTEEEPHRGFYFHNAEEPDSILGGFTIMNGYAPIENYGSLNLSGGGGIFCGGSHPTIINCIIKANTAGDYGGGIGCWSGSSPKIINCSITDNIKGGICDYSATIINCTIKRNSIYGISCGNGVLIDSTISDNEGVGIDSSYYVSPTIINCKISGNKGGGIDCHDSGGPQIINCLISGNRTTANGGGINCAGEISSPTISNCTIVGNTADGYGGGIFCDLELDIGPTITNTIFIANKKGAIYEGGLYGRGDPYVNNCLFYENNEGDYYDNETGTMLVGADQVNSLDRAAANIDDDPRFVDPGYWNPNGTPADANDDFWIDGDYHLLLDSPCVDTGDNTAVPPSVVTDLDGNPRIVGGTVDMGAYEFQGIQILYVDMVAPFGGDGKSWTTAFRHLQDALFSAVPPTEIRVALGIYKPHLNTYSTAPPSRTDTFQLRNGVTIKGGYAGIGAPDFVAVDPNIRDIEMFQTILSGDLDDNDIDVNDAWDVWREPTFAENSYHVVTGSGTNGMAVLDGFTISGGCASGPMSYDNNDISISSGAGMYNDSGSPTVINCTFRKNTTWTWYGQIDGESGFDDGNPSLESTYVYLPETSGAAVFNRDGSPTFRSCLFEDNVAFGPDASCAGAGVCNINSNPLLTNCVFKANVTTGFDSEYFGGAMANYNSSPTLWDCSFIDNRADYSCGGAIYNDESSPSLTGCTFRGNRADDFGGGMYNSRSESELRECEFIENVAAFAGGGMYNSDSNPRLTNCMFSGNSAQSGGAISISGEFSGTFTDCVFENNTADVEGGAIFHKGFGGESNIIRCEFRNGSAERGGAIYNIYDSLVLSECILMSNQAEYAGAAIYTDGDITLTNCLLANNHAQVLGGALANAMNTSRSINCTFVGNSANNGGAISSGIECDTTTINSIFWNNTAQTGSQIATTGAHYSSRLTVSYCDIENGLEGLDVPDGCTLIWGEGNIDVEPYFVDPDGEDNVVGTKDDNLRLSFGSPCFDTGDPNFMADPNETDLDGNPRVIGGRIDMGAYEFCGPVYVDDDAPNDPGPGDPQVSDPLEDGTEAHPFDTIQEGINVTKDGYAVLVRQGSYSEPGTGSSIDFLGKNIALTSEDPTDWDIVNNTIIRRYVQFSGTEVPSCKFAGFRISNLEGAIYGNHTHATISHCNISGNGPCGATVIKDCDGIISNCLITDNTTFLYCGIYPVVFGCNGLIKNCTIANNESGLSVGTATIENCIIYNNTGSQLAVTNGNTVDISYCNVQDGLAGVVGDGHVNWGPGNIDTDPCFVRLGYWIMDEVTLVEGDYHLRSEGWRWNTEGKSWTYDFVTSRCADAGNPGSPLRGELMSVPRDPNNVWGINLRVNMGAYGGTGQASMPPHGWTLLADLNNDGITNFVDFAYQAQDWLTIAPEQPGDLNRDGVLNTMDLGLLAEEWLQTTEWANQPPVVYITQPPDGLEFCWLTESVWIEANARDFDGTIKSVEFFINGNKVGEDNDGTDGWMCVTSFNMGTYILTAQAMDDKGVSTTSPPVTITAVECQ